MTEYKTLRDLDVRPGDTVRHEDGLLRTVEDIGSNSCCGMMDGSFWFWGSPEWSLVSRAEDNQPYSGDEPIPLRDMTAEQIGLLVKASFAGKVIEAWNADGSFWFRMAAKPLWTPAAAYRVCPEPHIETVDLIADGRVVGTIEMEDGKINPTSAVWEAIDE